MINLRIFLILNTDENGERNCTLSITTVNYFYFLNYLLILGTMCYNIKNYC